MKILLKVDRNGWTCSFRGDQFLLAAPLMHIWRWEREPLPCPLKTASARSEAGGVHPMPGGVILSYLVYIWEVRCRHQPFQVERQFDWCLHSEMPIAETQIMVYNVYIQYMQNFLYNILQSSLSNLWIPIWKLFTCWFWERAHCRFLALKAQEQSYLSARSRLWTASPLVPPYTFPDELL